MTLESALVAQLAQAAVSGLLAGGVYALPAVGLSLVWGVMKIVNIAHGVLALLASYLALTLFQALGLDPLLSLVILVPVFFAIGMLVQRGLVQPITGQPEISSLLVLFALTIVTENVITRLWSADFRTLSPSYAGTSFQLTVLNVSVARTISFILAVVAVFGLDAVLQRTYFGRAIRATAQNRGAAMLAGIDTGRISMLAFGLGASLAAAAGVALSLIYTLHPTAHILWVVKAFLVAVLGGVGNIRGAFAAGLLLGVAESYLGTFVSFRWVDFSVYVLLLLILLLRPQGLYGRATA
jgi:branched-chain amino acid transport system permease protein